MTQFAEIIVEHKAYTYAVPLHLQPLIKIGQQVTIPLRRREVLGFVVKLFVVPPDFATKEIIGIIDQNSYFDENLVTLAYWVAQHYKCYPETALKAILPR